MRRAVSTILLLAVVVAACAPKDAPPTGDSTPDVAATTPAPITLADVAGKWTVKAMPATGDSVIATYELNATADTSGWTMTFPGKAPIPIHILSMAGDSIVSHAGPYDSALRPGVKTEVHVVTRLVAGKLLGSFHATYKVTTADSVMHGRFEGTRM